MLPIRMLEIRYQDVVEDLATAARRIVDWVGLDWEDGCIKFEENRRPVRTASVVEVRQPV